MRRRHHLVPFALGVLLTGTALEGARAAERGPVVANYGYMQATAPDGKAAVLPLRHTAVKARVVGVMSSVEVTQQFKNPFARAIEAIYVFPLPHRAAVHAMTMHVGTRVITAEIKKRGEARAIYERAKAQGKTASLLEQERPNIFTQSVANILPGEAIKVKLSYVEELVPREGEYQFVFPMVVGPRYLGEGKPLEHAKSGTAGDTDRVKDGSRITPPSQTDERSGRDISIALELSTGVSMSELRSPTHKITLKQEANDLAMIELDKSDRLANRDFVVKYRLTGARPQVTLLANHEQRGGHFLLMIQPQHKMAKSDTAPKEYYFVVDTSGSMAGVPLARMKQAAKLCLAALQPKDTFQIARFATDAELFARAPVAPTPENVAKGIAFIDTSTTGGGTEFTTGLDLAFKSSRDPKRARIVLFMTDGLIGHEAEILRYIRENRSGANLFAFGVGASVNRFLIDGMARIGQGEPFVLLNRDNADVEIKRFFEMVTRPALTSIKVDFGKLAVSDVTPAQPADLFADRPIVLAGRFDQGGSGKVTIRGFLAGAPFEQKIKVTLPDTAVAGSRPAISYLWARRRIGELMDLHDTDPDQRAAVKDQVTALALKYNLMSKFTSFVAVDRVVRNESGETETKVIPQRAPSQAAAPPPPPPPPRQVATPPPPPEPSEAPRHARARLSADQVGPGDPEVLIDAPADTTQVTLVFPSGELKACRKDPFSGKWAASFLIPQQTADGIYAIRVLIALRSGEQLARVIRYEVDGRAPRVRVTLSPQRARPGAPVTLLITPRSLSPRLPAVTGDIGDPTFSARVQQDIGMAQARLPSGAVAELRRRPDGSCAVTFTAPARAGRYPVAVVVRDHARNKARHVVWLEVSP